MHMLARLHPFLNCIVTEMLLPRWQMLVPSGCTGSNVPQHEFPFQRRSWHTPQINERTNSRRNDWRRLHAETGTWELFKFPTAGMVCTTLRRGLFGSLDFKPRALKSNNTSMHFHIPGMRNHSNPQFSLLTTLSNSVIPERNKCKGGVCNFEQASCYFQPFSAIFQAILRRCRSIKGILRPFWQETNPVCVCLHTDFVCTGSRKW